MKIKIMTAMAALGFAALLALPVQAAPTAKSDGATTATEQQTDFSAHRRRWAHRHHRWHRHRYWGYPRVYWGPRYAYWGPRYYWRPRYYWGPRYRYHRAWYPYYRPYYGPAISIGFGFGPRWWW